MATKKAKMKLTPPPSDEAFIDAARNVPIEKASEEIKVSYPWEDARVREDLIKVVNIRLTEPYILKLKYLSDMTKTSQQALLRDALLPAIDEEIEKLISR